MLPEATYKEVEQTSRILRRSYDAYSKDAHKMTDEQRANLERLMDDMHSYFSERVRVNRIRQANDKKAWWPTDCGTLREELVRHVAGRSGPAAPPPVTRKTRVVEGRSGPRLMEWDGYDWYDVGPAPQQSEAV